MDFRRLPFNFTTTDPLKRQEELQRRFGLPVNKGNMFVDFANSGAMGSKPDLNSASNSPRLQHRVPIFVEGNSEPTKPSVDAQNVDTGRKPHVRVIPIEIEGEDTSKRHRWLSGSSEPIKERNGSIPIPVERAMKQPVQNPSLQSPKAARVCNIPIKIEGSDNVIRPKSPVKPQNVKIPDSVKHTGLKMNGCSPSKVAKLNKEKETCKTSEKKETPEQLILKKIQNVEEKMKGYHADVEKFSGTNKEKQYRYLDEMLTRCMLELDEIDTLGLDTIRLARKAAVKKVQASIDLLESKVMKKDCKQEVLKEPMEVESSGDQASNSSEDMNDENIVIEQTKNSEVADPIELNLGDQANMEIGDVNIEMTNPVPEQINKKVEKISIIEPEEVLMKPEEKEPTSKTKINDAGMNSEVMEPVQIHEVEATGDIAEPDIEPLVEEPLSDSKEENIDDMDLDSPDNENPSVQICEIENEPELEVGTNGQNLEITGQSDIPILSEQTVSSDANQIVVEPSELIADKQTETSVNSKCDC